MATQELATAALAGERGSVCTSGRVVVSAAVVMIAVFAGALDALVVRLVLIPTLLAVTRHAAWHQPTWLARILRNTNGITSVQAKDLRTERTVVSAEASRFRGETPAPCLRRALPRAQ